jgi:hypothetical protein
VVLLVDGSFFGFYRLGEGPGRTRTSNYEAAQMNANCRGLDIVSVVTVTGRKGDSIMRETPRGA